MMGRVQGFRCVPTCLLVCLLTLTASATQAQGSGLFAHGIPQDSSELALICKQYRSTRDTNPQVTDASLVIQDGEVRVLTGSTLRFRVPAGNERSAAIKLNGARPGSDFVYSVDKAATGTGYFWFKLNYDAASVVGDTVRNEIFVDQNGDLVSYTYVAKLREPDPIVGVKEFTVQCEPS